MIFSIRVMVGQDLEVGTFQVEELHKERQVNSLFFLLKEVKQNSLPRSFNLDLRSLIQIS